MQRAVNPQTGEVLFLVNNRWVPPSQTARNPQTGQFAYLVNNEWQIQDPFKKEEEKSGFFDRLAEAAQTSREPEDVKTRNPLMGFVARASGLAGAALEVPDTLAQLMSNLTGLPKDQVFEIPIDTVGKRFADKALNYEKDIGYAPSTQLKDLADNPLNAVPFIAERVVTSIPDMAAAYAAAPAYFAARTNEILKSRVENDDKTLAEATVGDVSAAAGAAAFETVFEKFATGRLLPGGGAAGKTTVGRIAKETGVQAGTEFAEELGTYTAETAGTERGFKPEEAVLAGIEGALVGGGLGSGAQTTREGIDAYQRSRAGATPAAVTPTTTPTPLGVTPTVTPTAAPGQSPVTPIPPSGNVLGGYNNAPDNTQTLITRTPDNRFQVTTVDTATGQSMDSGTFDTVEEADAVAGQIVGFTPPAPTAVTPTPPAVTPPTTPTPTEVTPIVGFETSLGSTYTLDEQGRSSRTKKSPGKGQGKTYAPHPVFYVTPQDSKDILADKVGGNASIRLGYEVDNKFRPIRDITDLPGGSTPLVAVVDNDTNTLRGFYRANIQPAVGLAPVEKLYNDDGTSNTHVGNPITKLIARPETTAPVTPTTEVAPTTAPPVVAPTEETPVRDQRTVQTELNRVRQSLRQMETAFKKKKAPESEVTRLQNMVNALEQELEQAKPTRRVPVFRSKEGNTWTGFGNTPAWLRKKLDQGMDLEDFRIRSEFNNKSQDELEETEIPYGFGRPMPETRPPKELEDLIAQSEQARRESPNLFNMLRGKITPEDVNDITPESNLNFLKAAKGRGRDLSDIVNDGDLDAFLDIPHNAENFDLIEATEYIKDLLRQDFKEDPTLMMSVDTRNQLRSLDIKISELEAELEPEDVNRELQAVYAEERAIAQEIEETTFEEQERGAAVPTGPPEALREPTPEERRRAELERDFFSLTPPTPPERTTPPGAQRDLFGVEGLERATPEKVAKRKAENAQQLSLFVDSQLPPNEDNQAGKTARREAVSTVDALQSTDTPLALALSTDYARRQRVSLVGQKVTGYDDLAVLSQVYRHPRFETFRLFFVNDANEVVSQLGVTSRLPAAVITVVGDSNIEYMKKVQDAAVQAGATGVWMLHNHPSGNVEVSDADRRVTKTFTDAFKQLAYKGHIVIDTNKYSVIAPEGYIQTFSKDMGQKELLQKNLLELSEAFNPIEVAKRVDENPQSMVVIAVSNDFSVTGITTIDNDAFKDKTPEQVTRILFRLAISQSGGRLFVASRDKDSLVKVAPSVEDGIWIEPSGQYKYFSQMFRRRTKFLFPSDRPGVVTPDTSKLFDFLRVPKVPRRGGYQYFSWPDVRKLMEKQTTIKVQEPQAELFGEDAKTLKDLDENLPKAKKKLPPGRSPELAAMAELLKEGSITKEEYDAAVNRFRPIPLYTEPLTPATDEQVVNALSSDKKPKANVSIPNGTKVGLRLDIPAWNNHKTFVVSIHEGRPKVTSPSPGKAIGYRSVALAKNVTFALGNQAKALEIAAGAAKDALQTMEGEYVNVSPSEALEMAKKAINDPRYVQLGFDPTRHAYFYDRRTTLPVVKADAVLQIGNMILARGVEYGSKQNFLYNIDAFQSNLFGDEESKALSKADEPVPAKAVQRGRSPELTEAADKLRRGEITKEEYEALVDKYSPVKVYAEVLKPATDAEVVNALASNKRQYANQPIAQGKRVGLRLDIPALQQHGVGVVSIHEPKPSIKSPKALAILSYRSVAGLKNVVFAVGDQLKALDTAAGAFKDKLQTMEGDYIDLSPEQAFAKAKEVFNNPDYIQVGLNPTRHAYFYDRLTMQPVVAADEVIQIGQFVMAKNPKYASKDDFLYDINKYPQVTQDHADQFPANTREEMIAEYASLRARRERLVRGVIEGGATVDLQRSLTHIDEMSKALKSEIEAEYVPNMSPENFLRKALEAYDKGDLSVDVLATIQATYNKTPWLLNGIRLSVRARKQPGTSSGNFKPVDRIVTLWNGTSGVEDPVVVRHEIMHSLEQMMTADQRNVLIETWQDALKKAVKDNPDQPSQEYFSKVLAFLDTPNKDTHAAAVQAMPSYDFYQYLNPSEYWAINAEKLMASKLGSSWDRFVKAVKKLFEGLKSVFGFNNNYGVHKVFDQLMRDKPTPMNRLSLAVFVGEAGVRPLSLDNISTNIFGQPLPKGTWGSPNDSKMDNVIYILQDKHIDTKRVVQNIKAAGKNIADRWDPYLQEELFHGRAAKQTQDFLKNELEPLMVDMRNRGLTMAQVEEYLHNRHAETRNKFNAKRDPKMPDGGSGILTADAQKYLAALTPQQKADFDSIAKRIDYMVAATQQIIVDTGQETQQTIDAWNKALPDYVPLQREEVDYDVKNVGIGVGSGIAVKGPFSRAAVGSSKQVVDILANLAMQRERAIVRGEKMRVSKALYGLVASNPNPTFWLAFDPEAVKGDVLKTAAELASLGLNPADIQNIIDEPVIRKIDPVTNQVVERPNALLVNSRTSIPVRINGKEKYVIFNAKDPRAERMAEALKNLDADQLGRVMGGIQQFTQFFARINTQYNPVFGVINFLRDTQAALIQVSNTPLKGDRTKILGGVPGAIRGIYAEERARRAGKPPLANSWSQLWEEFQQEGGQTGFRDQFSRQQERADALQAILDPSSWTKSPLGKVFTVGGTLKVPMEIARKTAAPLFDWLSDYNQTMENAIRLSAYKAALDKGMTKQQAASLAKNLTVNFNRKGQIGRQAGALYAFFNASVQGAARMGGTMFKYDGKGYKLSTIGRNIIGGGLVLGVAQAMTLAAMGFDEDEPPDFIKERNFIIPTGKDKYITIPMPLGYNVIPNTSRILTEWMLSGFKNTPKRVVDLTGAFFEMFNPLGNAGWSAQTFLPTVTDPIAALYENQDWTGKPIAKKDMSSLDPTPGYTRAKETASTMSKELAYYLNLASGGTDYTPGTVSPTPDQIDYLIGQLTGGVGRELLKAEQTITSQFTGEELPIYKVPLLGRFVGETTGIAAERNRFYNNLIELNKHEREIKGRIKDRIPTKDYLMEYPEARLYGYANQVERNIRTLRQRRDMLIEKGAPKEQVKTVENQMMVQMKRFNDRVKEVQQ